MYIRFNAGIRKAETTTVTFDTNRGTDAWFLIDNTRTATKDVTIPIGDDIANRRFDDFEIGDESIVFSAWASEPEGISHSSLIVTEPITVYAQYREMVNIMLDYNGGHDPFDPEETFYNAKFNPSEQFETPVDPKRDDPTLRFIGWSVNPDATEPDSEVVEGKDSVETLAEWLNGRTLYAVYGEPVSVKFIATGNSWMMDNPSVTTYENSIGRGHIFYGMAIMHYHPSVEHAGWIDQNGRFTMATSGIDGTYHVNEDSVFTSVLRYRMLAIGNGGRFPNGGIGGSEILTLRLSYDGWNSTFSYEEALEMLGNPIPEDESKHFLGFATNPNATEPDIIDGETYLEDIGNIYAIWGDEEAEPEPEPETEPDSEDEAPEVPDTGSNFIKENYSTITTLSGVIVTSALAIAIWFYIRRKHSL